MHPRADIAALVAAMGPRERAIVVRRLGSDAPATLEELGQEFAVTRERIRQLESEIRVRLAAFPWVVVMAGAVPVHGRWVRHAKQLGALESQGLQWTHSIVEAGPSILQLLVAAGEVERRAGGWYSRRMAGREGSPGRWDQLVEAGRSGTVPIADLLADLDAVGIDESWATAWLADNGLVVRHGIVRSEGEKLGDFLLRELAAAGGSAHLDAIGEWVDGRWSFTTAKNLLQSDDRFTRVDVKEYALASLGLPEYRGIREGIRTLIAANGPLPLADVVDILCNAFDVAAVSVEHYAQERPFRVSDGVVYLRSTTTTRRTSALSLADIPEGRGWGRVFFTPDGYAFRLTVTEEHLRGSGHHVQDAVARIVGARPGDVWEMPLSGMAGTLKVSRQHQRQPSIGSIKSALEQLNARVGDTAFLRFTGSEGAITSAAITIERRGTSTRDPFAEALALVGCQGEVDDPFEAINAALGVDVEFAADLVEVATRRKDSELAAVLAQIAAI